MMEGGEVVSSAASGSDRFTHTEDDGSLGSAFSDEDTLNLVEDAILRTLERYSSHQQQHGGSRHSESAKTVDGGSRPRGRFNSEEQHSADSVNAPPARISNPENVELLSDLLEQVHTLRRNQGQGSRRPKETLAIEVQDVHNARSFDRRRSKAKKPSSSSTEELRVMLDAATVAAKAAADAAEAAAQTVARNTEAIDVFAKSMKSPKKRRKAKSATASDGKKEILKSNRITHWVLGFMVVTTIVWRFGVTKVVKGVTSKLNDPFGYFGRMMGGEEEESDETTAQKSPEKTNLFDKLSHVDLPAMLQNDSEGKAIKSNDNAVEKSAEKGNLLDRISHVELPSMLQDDSDLKEIKSAAEKKGKETKSSIAKSAAAMEVKTKEAGKEVEKSAFSFANFFHFKPKEN